MIYKFNNKKPETNKSIFIAPGSFIIGDVSLDEGVNIWYNAVIRGDFGPIKIGKKTNIQENSSLHIDPEFPLTIGNYVTVGHNAILHGCTIKDRVLIGMGAIILNGAIIGEESIIGAGTLIPEGKEIPPHSLVLGVPGKIVRQITKKEIEFLNKSAEDYYLLALEHQKNMKS
jgi:carbonic anhydrase/acetyltransferase-like protein (isoleucine patch superfamily)